MYFLAKIVVRKIYTILLYRFLSLLNFTIIIAQSNSQYIELIELKLV